jgi:ribosomal protein S27E
MAKERRLGTISISFEQWCIDNNKQNILNLWDYELNSCKPNEITYGTKNKYYFKCPNRLHKSELKTIKECREIIKCSECNSISFIYPHLVKYFVNKNEAIKYKPHSNKFVLTKCPDCGYEKNRMIRNLVRRNFSCPKCGDGISYPEKFMFNLLEQLNIKFERQKKFDWSENKRYDFYLPDYNCIIETHGIQHYEDTKIGTSLKEIQENDIFKEELANKNDINNYIIINCKESNLNFIRSNILSSKLPLILNVKNIDNIDWLKCNEYAISNMVKKVCDLWNDGLNKNQISNELKIGKTAINNYLNRGYELDWCNYNSKNISMENLKSMAENNRKKIICINNKQVFNSVKEASKFYNIKYNHFFDYFRNKSYYAGKHPETNEKLKWMYYEDYLKQQVGDNLQ